TTYTGGAETRQRRLEDKLQLDIVISDADGVRLVNDRLTGEGRLRYTFTDHLGSCGGEADEQGNITAREEYLPFGASAGSDEETTEVTDRTRRYSGKERDATGLLYYGWRYHQPELGRWLSADPGGLVDGVNLFRFTRNNPISIIDTDGRGCGSSKVSASQQAYDNWEAQQAGPSLPQFVSNPDVEAKFNAEGAVVYSGVEQLKSNAANVHAVYSTSLKYSIYLLGTASAKIATLDPKNEGLDVNKMKSRFDNLKKKLERRQEGGDLCNTIFGFKGYKRGGTDGVAFTVPDHYDQNIHFNLDVNKEAITVENIAATIIHEGSHLLFDAKDYYYVVDNAVLADDKETYASAASSLDGTLNKLLVKGTGTKAVLDAFDSMMDNLIEDDDDTQDYRSDDLADFENSKNIKHDKNYKKEHIMELFENNADSYPLLAFKYGVERTHQKRMQRLKY
ncbi:RHS repeat-associated core domain-containing protein, partial [Enterobacter chuandaensis]